MKKLLPLLILTLFLASCVAPWVKNRGVDQIAVSDVGQSDCVAGDCENGVGKLIFSSGASYAGRWKNGKYHGQGRYVDDSGVQYVGEWKDGLLNGHGTFTGNDNSSYVGEWKDGTRHGKGVLFENNGEIKSGTWVKGSLQQTRTVEEVSRFLKNKYPQFPGFDYQARIQKTPQNGVKDTIPHQFSQPLSQSQPGK